MDRSIKRRTSKPRFYFFETSERTMNNRSQGTKGEAREVERALMFQLLLGFKDGLVKMHWLENVLRLRLVAVKWLDKQFFFYAIIPQRRSEPLIGRMLIPLYWKSVIWCGVLEVVLELEMHALSPMFRSCPLCESVYVKSLAGVVCEFMSMATFLFIVVVLRWAAFAKSICQMRVHSSFRGRWGGEKNIPGSSVWVSTGAAVRPLSPALPHARAAK